MSVRLGEMFQVPFTVNSSVILHAVSWDQKNVLIFFFYFGEFKIFTKVDRMV